MEKPELIAVDGHPNRLTFKREGYDCHHAPCRHTPKGEHGISGGAWHFIAKDGPVAVALEVLTSFYPETVPPAHRDSGWPARKDSITGSVTWHRATPTARDAAGQQCEFVPGGRCYDMGSGFLAADEFAPLMAETFEQPEPFWKRLEEMAAEFRREVEG
jgi:hypothetical protein